MKKSKFSESQIVNILKEAEAAVSEEDLTRQHGFSKASFYKWKAKYGGVSLSEVKRMKELKEENRRFKQMYANPSLEHEVLKDMIEKTLQVEEKRELARYAIQEFGVSERQACRRVQVSHCAIVTKPSASQMNRSHENCASCPRVNLVGVVPR